MDIGQKRVNTQVIHIERGLGVKSKYHRSKLAFYGVGGDAIKEYDSSPYAYLSHILMDKDSPSFRVAKHVKIQTLGRHGEPWLAVLAAVQRSSYGAQVRRPALPVTTPSQQPKVSARLAADIKVGLFRVELTIWSDMWIKSLVENPTHLDEMILVLDHVQDPRNFGALIRTAAFFGVTQIIVPTDRQAELTETVIHCARGGVGYVKIVQVVNLARALDRLKAAGYWVLGADMAGEDYQRMRGFYAHVALVIGNEGKGLSTAMRRKCDRMVSIAGQGNGFHSLNVSVACGILMCGLKTGA